jgi:hypothetical protein
MWEKWGIVHKGSKQDIELEVTVPMNIARGSVVNLRLHIDTPATNSVPKVKCYFVED